MTSNKYYEHKITDKMTEHTTWSNTVIIQYSSYASAETADLYVVLAI